MNVANPVLEKMALHEFATHLNIFDARIVFFGFLEPDFSGA